MHFAGGILNRHDLAGLTEAGGTAFPGPTPCRSLGIHVGARTYNGGVARIIGRREAPRAGEVASIFRVCELLE